MTPISSAIVHDPHPVPVRVLKRRSSKNLLAKLSQLPSQVLRGGCLTPLACKQTFTMPQRSNFAALNEKSMQVDIQPANSQRTESQQGAWLKAKKDQQQQSGTRERDKESDADLFSSSRSGDAAPVPEPSDWILFSIALVAIIGAWLLNNFQKVKRA